MISYARMNEFIQRENMLLINYLFWEIVVADNIEFLELPITVCVFAEVLLSMVLNLFRLRTDKISN